MGVKHMLANFKTHLTSVLNTLSDSLGKTIVFNVTDSYQLYETWMDNADNEEFTPCVVYANGSSLDVQDTTLEIVSLGLEVYGKKSERNDLEVILNRLPTGSTVTLDSKAYIQAYGRPFNYDFTESSDGNLQERVTLTIQIQMQYTKGSVSGKSTTFTIDGTAVPFVRTTFRKDKPLLPNIAYGTNSSTKIIAESLELVLPITSNTKIQELFTEVLDASYNKKHTLVWTIGGATKTADYILKVGIISYDNNAQPIAMTLAFDLAIDRKTLTIDGVSIPIIQWQFANQLAPSSKTVNKISVTETRSHAVGLTVTFVYDGSSKADELIATLNRANVNKAYSVVIQVGSVSTTYSMTVLGGKIASTERPDVSFEISFAERDGTNG